MRATKFFDRVCEVFRTIYHNEMSGSLSVYLAEHPQPTGDQYNTFMAPVLCIICKTNGTNHILHYDSLMQHGLSTLLFDMKTSVDESKQYRAEIFPHIGKKYSSISIFSEAPTDSIIKYKAKYLVPVANLDELLNL